VTKTSRMKGFQVNSFGIKEKVWMGAKNEQKVFHVKPFGMY